MDKSDRLTLHYVVSVLLITIALIAGQEIGIGKGQRKVREKAVELGYGAYSLDEKTGEIGFHFWTPDKKGK